MTLVLLQDCYRVDPQDIAGGLPDERIRSVKCVVNWAMP
jgi:hypothetical protein